MDRYKQDNSSYGIGLTTRINNFKRVFLFFLLFCFLIVIIFSESVTYFKKKNMAENIVNGITTILIQGDNRQVMEILNNTFKDEFNFIQVENLVSAKNFVAFGNGDESLLSKKIIIPVYFDKEMTKKAAVISFSYRLLPYSSIWLFLLIFIVFSAVFIFNYFKKKIIIEYYSELKIQESETQRAIYKQVSHDIRSPLAALNMIISSTEPQSESDRVIMRSAVQRVNDIANQLLNKGKASILEQGIQENKCEVELLSTLIDSIVSEKRIQFREKQNIEIESMLNDAYGLFSNVNATELLRTISNTLNNAIEALPNATGKIVVSLNNVDSFNVIKISDNGKGIPKHILEKLGQMGVSHGKVGSESGSGLGVYHAKKTIESFGGIFEVESVENKGTIILIKLPKADTPSWFIKNIQVPQVVVALDDDLSIHQIWKERFKNQNIDLISFTSATVFKEWMSKNSHTEVLFLIDYELLNQNDNGLDLIKEFRIATQSILVTSRYDEFIIKEEAQVIGLRLLSKSIASIVPLVFDQKRTISDKKKEFFDCILIDDDQLIRLIWERAALKNNKSFLAFSHPDDFFKEIHRFDLVSGLYFDSELGNDIKGEEVSKRAYFEFGFKNIYLCTGHSPDHFTNVAHLKKVMGKDPEF